MRVRTWDIMYLDVTGLNVHCGMNIFESTMGVLRNGAVVRIALEGRREARSGDAPGGRSRFKNKDILPGTGSLTNLDDNRAEREAGVVVNHGSFPILRADIAERDVLWRAVYMTSAMVLILTKVALTLFLTISKNPGDTEAALYTSNVAPHTMACSQ